MHSMTNDTWRSRRADLRRFVSKRVSDRHKAEDIVQDVLVRAHESMHRLESAERLSAWLARIATNRIIDHYRSRRPAEELPEDLAAAQPEDDPVVTLAPCLPTMVERLPATYRDAVRLSELEEVPQREVARRLGISLSGAKSRVQRGRGRVVASDRRSLLQGLHDGHDHRWFRARRRRRWLLRQRTLQPHASFLRNLRQSPNGPC